ncbi:DEAD/DEAH box helicase [Pseudoclavibacter alba]|uniref:DEAD/DEAH box helicase n=1 Tax=Pseudoclavibacter albus TaxID=272241 RepID=UPI0019D10FA5|nr:DEAD/DEAH box helicase [Pseudoclavibacter alba]MBN6777079.1 DEAD/DEAH box helicase [Pseudoclavibacter alba]
MPKGKGGFKPAKNYVPRNGKGRSYRPARPGDAPRRARPIEDGGAPREGFDRAERGGYARQGRPERDGFRGGNDRGGYRGGRDGRRDERGGYQRDERRGFGRDDRFSRDDRGFDRGRRGFQGRRDDRDDRRNDSRGYGHRDDRGFNRDDRFSRDDRGDRFERRDEDFQATRERIREERRDRGTRQHSNRRDDRRDRAEQARQLTEDQVLARFQATQISKEDAEGVEFEDLGLGQNIVGALADLGAAHPFPIQVATIPDVLGGRDVLGRGRTGSGKTIAFGAPLVERLLLMRGDDRNARRRIGRSPRALIVAPTRELALQIDRTIQPIARSVGLFTTQVYGGVPQQRQVTALRRGVDIVIGTPGRIEDLERQGHLDLSDVRITVLDEADQMCDLGFLDPVQRILRMTKEGGQKLLFSATLDQAVLQLVDEFLVDAAVHEVAGEEEQHADIDHRVLVVERGDRDPIIEQLARSGGRVLVFTRTRLGAERVAMDLEDAGVRAVTLHGDLNQAKRQRNLKQLESGRVDVLVATDVAARGIHVDDIRLVLQADMPEEYKTYLHRAGRTGRAGQRGTVITFIAPSRRRKMAALLDRAGVDAPMMPARPGGPELDEFMHDSLMASDAAHAADAAGVADRAAAERTEVPEAE